MARPESIVPRHRSGYARTSRSAASRFWADRAGATAIEYGFIAGLTCLGIAGTLKLFATRMNDMYAYIGTTLAAAF